MTINPTFVGFYDMEQAYDFNGNDNRTIVPFDVNADDLIIVRGFTGDQAIQLTTPSASGGDVTWNLEAVVNSGAYSMVWVWSGLVNTSSSNVVVSSTVTPTGNLAAINARLYRSHGGVGSKISGFSNTGFPSVVLPNVKDNSAIVYATNDWNAIDGETRAFTTDLTEDRYFFETSIYTIYCAQIDDVGVGGSKTLGMSSPSGMKWSAAAVEIMGIETSNKGVLINEDGHPILSDTGLILI